MIRLAGGAPALLAALGLALVACASAPAGGAADGPRVEGGTEAVHAASDGPFVYVANQDAATISVIDAGARAVVETVDLRDLGFGPNAKPHDTAVDPDGGHWYVTLIGENRVLRFDRDNRLVGQVEMEVPGLVVAHPAADLLVIGRSMSAVNPPPSVALVRRSDMTLLEEVDVLFPRPHALAVRRDGRAWTASLAENRIAAIDLDALDVSVVEVPEPAEGAMSDTTAGAHAGHTPHTLVEFALAPDGRTLVAGGEISGELLVFDLADPDAPGLVERIPLGGAPWHPTFTPDGRWVFVPLNRADQVAVVDARTWTVTDRIEGRGLAEPHGAVAAPDGRTVFVSSNNTGGGYVPAGDDPRAGTVVAIDVATREIVDVIEVGANAAGLEAGPAPR